MKKRTGNVDLFGDGEATGNAEPQAEVPAIVTATEVDAPQVIDLGGIGQQGDDRPMETITEPPQVIECGPVELEDDKVTTHTDVVSTLDRIQNENREWAARNFGPSRKSWHPLLGLQEEIGELSHAYLKKSQGIRDNENHDAAMKDAVGDIVIFLADFCSLMGYRLEQEVVATWAKVKQRDWKASPTSGGSQLPELLPQEQTNEPAAVHPESDQPTEAETTLVMPDYSRPIWNTQTTSAGVLEGIPRFGDKRKAAVMESCGTLAALRDKINAKGGLTAIEGVGGKIADAIEENLTNWLAANSDKWDEPVEAVGVDSEDDEDDDDSSETEDVPQVETQSEQATHVEPQPPCIASAETDNAIDKASDDDLLAGLNVIGLSEESDDQAKLAHSWLVDCVRRYRKRGKVGYAVEPHYEPQFNRGASEAENGVPGDDCIYTSADVGMAWTWGWVTWTFENRD